MPNLANIVSLTSQFFFPNMQVMKALTVIAQDVFTATFTLAGPGNIISTIVDYLTRITTLEDKTANQSRAGTITRWTGVLKTNELILGTPSVMVNQSFNLTTGSAYCNGGISTPSTLETPPMHVAAGSGKVGIINAAPTYQLDITGSARLTGNLEYGNQYVVGNTWYRPLSTATTLSSATGFMQSFPVGNFYPNRIIVLVQGLSFSTSLTNATTPVITLGTSIAPFTGSFNTLAVGGQWFAGTSTASVAPYLTGFTAAPMIIRSSSKSTVVNSGAMIFTNMGNNWWTIHGTFKNTDGSNYGVYKSYGSFNAPSQATSVRFALARDGLNGGSDTVYTSDTTGRVSGKIQIILE